MKRLARMIVCLLSVGVLLVTDSARGEDERVGRPTSRTELEVRARELDARVIELQHSIIAARHKGDVAAMEKAKKDLATVQTERVETLRTLGELP